MEKKSESSVLRWSKSGKNLEKEKDWKKQFEVARVEKEAEGPTKVGEN